ncbi:MAG: hypothetical protein JNM86_10775 [Phycisphaerae bacterium]|nr:hypothetical protein [Phycisphaerae bacterium]MBN8598641.1 hypothetical protein [Planctomycetota bacterium]
MVEVLANAADASQAKSIGRGVFLIALLCLGLIVLMAALVLGIQSRRRARLRNLAKETQQRRAEDPWRVSAERTDIPSAEELYRASGFDQDDTRIEDSPKFGDEGPDESDDGSGRGRRRKPKKPDQF